MSRAAYVLEELDSIGVAAALDDSTAAGLARTGLVEIRPTAPGHWLLIPCGRVGAVRIRDTQVEVRPKDGVRLAHLLFLLGYAKDPGIRDEFIWADKHDDLWPVMAWSLAQSTERALERGVQQGYRTLDEALRTVRGRIRFGDQLARRPGRLMPIEVTHDEYSPDTPENQILLAAIHRMLGVPGLDPAIRRRLLHLTGRLEGVTRLAAGSPLPAWTRSRLNTRYHAALALASVILRHASTRSRANDGSVEMSAFVVTMWKVFEDFVTAALKARLAREPGATLDQKIGYLAGGGDWQQGSVTLRPDVLHLDESGRPQLIFDAKYKVAGGDGRYANADHYQMLAYCTALKVPRAWLIYAGGSGEAESSVAVKNVDVEITTRPLDLSQHPLDILRQVDDIASAALASNRVILA